MDPSTDIFVNSPPQMHTFSPPSCSIDVPAIHCQQTPGYSLIQHLLQPAPKQTGGKLGSNICTQRQQDWILEKKNGAAEVEEEIEGDAEGVIADERILQIKKRQGNALEWNQDLLGVKRMKLESQGRDGEDEKIGRKKRKEREELKEQLEEVRERLEVLQERVWRAFGEKHWSEDERKWKSRNDFTEDEDTGVYDEEDIDGRNYPFENYQKRHKERLKHKGLEVEGVEGMGGTLWWDCTGLFSGDWDGEMGREGEEGGQKFAQALKLELGSAVARVIDRVLRLYTETTESTPSSPPAAVSFSDGAREKGGWGGLRRGQKRAKEVEDKETAKDSKTNPGHSVEPTTPLAVRRSADICRKFPGPSLPSHQHLHLHHPSPLPLPEPSLLSPGSQPKDHSSSSFHAAPSAPSSSFPPPPPPPPPLPPLPLLHYSMQQLFSRTLPHLPPPPRKDFHLNAEAFNELAHPSFPPPLPLLGHLEPILSRPGRDRESGRGMEVGMRGGGGLDAVDLYLTAAGCVYDRGEEEAAQSLGWAGFISLDLVPTKKSQEGLSPCHLKKAKLMFFYTRYPSSNTLKTYFPDVKFNRCVTSQMIKWFSNFREFFYIQMERFARQAVREALTRDGGPQVCRDRQLRVGHDTELYRILNMHYNKSNVYQVPERFIEVSEVALREFYAAIWTGRDSDPCWKKGIYKIICKLDSPVPDAFRLPGCPVG